MADKQPAKAKRLVKNPETFRERALKATDQSDKPRRFRRVKSAGGKLVKPVRRPVGKIVRFKPLLPLVFVLRMVGKILLPVYIRNSWRELRQVTWPNWRESRRLTYAVLVFSVAFGLAIAIVDYGLDKLFRNILLK